MDENIVIDIKKIKELIPHRFPMLMIDKVIDIVDGKSAVGIKNISANEHFFQGHFPTMPVMPGVLVIEAMAQTSGVLVMHTLRQKREEKLVYFMSIDKVRFRKLILPGDTLKVFVETVHNRGHAWKFKGIAEVNKKVHAEATYTAMIIEKNGK